MEIVLVGLSGAGKTTVGRALAGWHGAAFVDVDAEVEAEAGRPVATIFADEGEAGFRRRERDAIARAVPVVSSLAGATTRETEPRVTRVIAAGGGAVIDPANRWRLYRARRVVWLDAAEADLADRLLADATRPLLAGTDGTGSGGDDRAGRLRRLRAERERWYAAGVRVDAVGDVRTVVERVERALAERPRAGDVLLAAATPIGRLVLGSGNMAGAVTDALQRLGTERLALVSEPEAWRLHGERLCGELEVAGVRPVPLLLPRGERAKTIRAYAELVRSLARARLERGDPLLALGGGAVGDAAGFAAATYLRGVPLLAVPTTLLAQIDSAIGGKTGLDLPEGKNLVGAFHQPHTIVLDLETLRTLPVRQRRAALGEAVKYAVLGDEALFRLLEERGTGIVAGADEEALAELVERSAWRKVEVVSADEREAAGRITLNLGHSLGHAIEAAAGYHGILHGEAVALGLRGALLIGAALGVTPPERRERILALLGSLDLTRVVPDLARASVLEALGRDKKHRSGRLRWVLPTADAVVIRDDVPDDLVVRGLEAALAPSPGDRRSRSGRSSGTRRARG